MSFGSIRTTYKQWASGDQNIDYQLVETLEFSHPKFSETLYVCDSNTNLVAQLEDAGGEVTFYGMPFNITFPNMRISTDQTITIDMDPLEGSLYEELSSLTPQNRLTPITLVHRSYLDGDTAGPIFLPVPTYKVQRVTVDFNRVNISASSTLIPRRRAGQTYTLNQFPTLRDV